MPRPCPAALCRLAAAAPADPAPDPQLLRAFLASRSEAAFAELVRRHGPMVLAVCRRVLGHAQDAEDAFQAAFLVFARRAGTIRGANLGGWLYGVAVRTARGVRIMRDRRRKKEAVLANGRREPAGGWSDQPADIGRSPEDAELAAILDEELAFLPAYYRLPVVLCELQGRSRKEAAAELNIPEGTLSSRLAAAKRKLADRLTRRGVTATAAAVAAVLADHAAARVPGHLARAAAEALPGSVAARVADGVVKALFAAQLKSVVVAVGLAVGLVGGAVLVSDGTGGTATAAVPADPKPAEKADPAAALMKQLGDPDFATREAAEKALRKLGVKAKPALRAGTRDPNPEVSRRAAAALAVVRREQLSAAFIRLIGDDPSARDLFARIMSAPRGVDALEAALDHPNQVNDLYRTRTAELLRVAAGHPPVDADGKPSVPTEPDVRTATPVPFGDVAGWLFLGALQPGTGPWQGVTHPDWENRLSSHISFLPEDDYTSAKPIAAAYEGPIAAPLKKLTAAWLAKRRENGGLRAGLTLAIRYDIAEALTGVRAVLSDPKPAEISPWNLAAAAVFAGLHGSKADLPLLARHTADERVHQTILNLPPGTDLTFARPRPQDGRDLFCQVRDAAAVAMCKLADKNPADFGFPPFPATKHPDGRPMSLHSATAVGFKSKADRAAAFAKAATWLKSFEPPAEPRPVEKPDPAAEKLAKQLGDPDFVTRDMAMDKLRALGPRAIPALSIAARDPNPEIAKRAGYTLVAVRADFRDAFAKQFDPKKTEAYSHPVWKRYVKIVGDSPASRALFARIIANPKWLRTLDAAEADPAGAGHAYRVGIAEMFRGFDRDPAQSPPWPCDRVEEAAYLMLLGSHPDPNPPAELTGDEIPPKTLRNTAFLGRGIIHGEEQIIHARGRELGFAGQWFDAGSNPVDGPPGLDRAFAKLYAAWLTHRDPASPVVPRGLRIATGHGLAETLPFARRIAANDFEPKRTIPPLATIAALETVARFGTRADLPLFERHFGDETNAAAADKARTDGARDYYRPAPASATVQVRDVALGLALLLHNRNPRDFGFVVRQNTFHQKDGRYLVPGDIQLHLGFLPDEDRAEGFKKAKAWLAEQKEPNNPKK